MQDAITAHPDGQPGPAGAKLSHRVTGPRAATTGDKPAMAARRDGP